MGLAPVVPTFGTNGGIHVGPHKHRLRVRAPGAPQVDRGFGSGTFNAAIVKHKAMGRIGIGGSSCKVTAPKGNQGTGLEPGGCPSENKIDRAFYITIVIVLPAACLIGIKGILMPQKTTIVKGRPVATHTNGNGLTYRTGTVFKSDVVGAKIVSENKKGRRSGGSHFLTKAIELLRIIVVSQHHIFGTASPKNHLGFGCRQNQLFFINTGANHHYGRGFSEIRDRHYGFLNRSKITAAISSHHKVSLRLPDWWSDTAGSPEGSQQAN